MKTISTLALLGLSLVGLPAHAGPDVGISVQISQPGVYGRIDIGRFPQPQLVLPQPVLAVHRPVSVAAPQPVYMWVPPGHRKDWRRHCGAYQACGVPVYFVRHDWYDSHVHSRHKGKRGEHGEDRGHGKGQGKGKGKGD